MDEMTNAVAAASDEEPRVLTERRGRVVVIRMNRPTKRNAVDAAMTAALDRAFDDLDDDPDVWCGVLSGGPKNFCAGTDLINGPGEPTARGGRYGVVGRRRATPLVAAVEGYAYGGGLELAFTADMVVAGRSASFGLPEVTHGLVANAGALFRTHRELPPNIAKQMLLTGDPITADGAYGHGLVNEIVDDGAAENAAIDLAQRVAANAPCAVRATLATVETLIRERDELGWDLTRRADDYVHTTADFHEGLRSFAEKRSPVWTGR